MKPILLLLLYVQLSTSIINQVCAQGHHEQIARSDSLLFRSNIKKAKQGYLDMLAVADKNNNERLRLNALIGLYKIATTHATKKSGGLYPIEMRGLFYPNEFKLDNETKLKFYAIESQRLSDNGELLKSLEIIKRAEPLMDSLKVDPSHSKELILFAKGTCLIRISDYSNAEKVLRTFWKYVEIAWGTITPTSPMFTMY